MAAGCAALAFVCGAVGQPASILKADDYRRYVEEFNRMEPETVVNTVPNSEAWAWMKERIPLFECPDAAVQEIYYFRWWALRKHLKRDASGRFVFTEFITKPRPISSALGHHLMEGRWLRDQQPFDDYVLYWLRGNEGKPQEHLHKYSSWLMDALCERYLVTGDKPGLVALLPDLVADYGKWESEKKLPSGLFWQYDVRDAMEESISGGRKAKNVRPTINSYMFGNARAVAAIARLANDEETARRFEQKAAELRKLTLEHLWNPAQQFFEVRREDGNFADVREELGFIPWYFNLPDDDPKYAKAWLQLADPKGFLAPFGITTAERRHPQFRSHGVGTCEWDGAVWPFATSQTLVALANALRNYPQNPLSTKDYFDAFLTYVKSQRYDGKPYIGEYLDEISGRWLKGRDPRSSWYNHSTFADLLIAGVIGLVPRDDDVVEVAPLLPHDAWSWFCLDGVRYHGRNLTVIWDRDGTHYGRGAGMRVFVDGKPLGQAEGLKPLKLHLPKDS
ncbi:glycoside hydrolase [Opitutaceae bacterium EW11]|nr:glycoside hydrolase [Opitutaceae bacterium EW11]